MRTNRKQALIFSLITIVVIVSVWAILTESGLIRPIFLPSPFATFKAVVSLVVDGRFFRALFFSFTRITIATLLAAAAGSLLGVLMGVSSRIESILNPITQPLRYLPITALIPLLVLWFGIGETMRIGFLFLGIVFYFIPLVSNAIKSVPMGYIDVAKSFGAKKGKIIWLVQIPNALPQIFDGLIVVNAIGWTYVVLAEIINAREGLGYLINIAGRLQRSDEVFAGIFLIAVVAIVSDQFLRMVRNKLFSW